MYRFYVPVRVGSKIYTVRISALHNIKNDSLKMSNDLYDVILEDNQRSASAIISDTESKTADTISIAEMLQNVKETDGELYIKPTDNTLFQKGIKYDKNGKYADNQYHYQ